MNGGAVELSWKLRASSGSFDANDPNHPPIDFVDCDSGQPGTGAVTDIQLSWDVDGTTGSRRFGCQFDHGVTGFDLPEGQALLSVSPVCGDHIAASDTYKPPPPEQRTVTVGNTVSLGAVELVLKVSYCCTNPAICPTDSQQLCVCQ